MSIQEQWEARLLELARSGSASEFEELAQEMSTVASAAGKVAVSNLEGEDGIDDASKMLLLELGPSSLEGLLRSPNPQSPEMRAWLIARLLENELQTRARVRARIMGLLDDREWLPDTKEGPYMEQFPPRRRVCDEAYVAMRALTYPEEDQVGFSVESEQFLHMPTELKDEMIEKAKTAHVWNMSVPAPGDD